MTGTKKTSKSLIPSDKKVLAELEAETKTPTMMQPALDDAAAMLAGFMAMPNQLAKNNSELADKRLGGFVSNLIGYHWGDELAHKRMRNWIKLCQETKAFFERRGTKTPEDISPNLAAPLLEACIDEEREKMQKLWAGLLATARDPKMRRYFKIEFIDILKKLDPSDALVLQTVYELIGENSWNSLKIKLNPKNPHTVFPLNLLRENTGLDSNEIEVSLGILHRYGLLDKTLPLSEPHLSATGMLFIKAVS